MNLIKLSCEGVEKSLHLGRITPRSVAQLFHLNENNILLTDSTKVSFVPSEDNQSFYEIKDAIPPFIVEGAKRPESSASSDITSHSNHYQPYQPRPMSGALRPHAPPTSYGLNPTAVPGGRSPVSTFGGTGGSRRQNTQTPQETCKTLKVYHGIRDPKSGKPSMRLKYVHITLDKKDDCNVNAVNRKLQSNVGCEDLVICDKNGAEIVDDATTRTPEFWGFGRGASTNATKYFALPPIVTEDEDDLDSGPTRPKYIPMTDEEIDRIATGVVHKRFEEPMKKLLMCYFCEESSRHPVICTTCGYIVGCKKCVDRYIADGNGDDDDDDVVPFRKCPQPTCGVKWPRDIDDEYSGFIKLRGFDAVQKLY